MDEKRDNSVGEEISAMGQRAKGAIKEGAGAIAAQPALEREGEREQQIGKARQESNEVFDNTYGDRTTTTGTGSRMVTGLFRDRDSAERAYSSVSQRGYGKDDVNLLMTDETRNRYFNEADTELGSKALEGAGAGAAIGGTAGAILGAIAAIGTNVVLPGLGLVIAGPIAAALAGAGAGGATGGLIGALIGAGIPEDRANLYESGIKDGGIVMGVNPRSDEDAEYFEREWKNHRGEHIYR
jgi:uncharacterized protein YjbJ (UPF0337 family)